MSLNSAFEIGRSALLTSQLAMRVAGNNMANAVTPGYARRTIHLSAMHGINGIGQGVIFSAARREIDLALQSRFRDAISREANAAIDQRFLGAIEAMQNELGDTDISSSMNEFFNAFSELANTPSDTALRSLVVERGVTLAGGITDLRSQYHDLGQEVITSIEQQVGQVNGLLNQIAQLNQLIAAESGSDASALVDERDLLVTQLSQYLDIATIEHESGMTDVLVGSVPLVLGGQAQGVEVRFENGSHGIAEASIRVLSDGSMLPVNSGTLGGLLRQREDTIIPAIEALETFSRELIWQVNRLHSQGQGLHGYETLTSGIAVEDTTVPLNEILDFPISNADVTISLRDPDTGEITESWTIDIDGETMSLDEIAASISFTTNGDINVGVTADGRLQFTAVEGREIVFSDDHAGVLAALEINTFFSGSSAGDISISADLQADAMLVATGQSNIDGSADTAVAIAGLREAVVSGLGDQSLTGFWSSAVGTLAVRTSAANGTLGATSMVRDGLGAQMQSVSGVSLDEESINLLTFERQYQAAARYIQTIDQTIQTLLSMV